MRDCVEFMTDWPPSSSLLAAPIPPLSPLRSPALWVTNNRLDDMRRQTDLTWAEQPSKHQQPNDYSTTDNNTKREEQQHRTIPLTAAVPSKMYDPSKWNEKRT